MLPKKNRGILIFRDFRTHWLKKRSLSFRGFPQLRKLPRSHICYLWSSTQMEWGKSSQPGLSNMKFIQKVLEHRIIFLLFTSFFNFFIQCDRILCVSILLLPIRHSTVMKTAVNFQVSSFLNCEKPLKISERFFIQCAVKSRKNKISQFFFGSTSVIHFFCDPVNFAIAA